MDLELAGKVAIVTGGSRGIGKAVARQLVAEGAAVCLVARDRAALDAAAAELRAGTPGAPRVLAVSADTGDDTSVRAMVETVARELGRIDILVNAAAQAGGQAPPPTIDEITDALFWDDVNVKLLGYMRCARAVAPHMRERGWGRIINIGGLAARQTGSLIGTVRNAGVAALTKQLADELGPHGIQVSVVHPGLTRTEATAGVIARRAEREGTSEAAVEARMAGSNAIRRLLTAEEVAYVIAFLASPKSIAINGDAIAAGGGAPRAIYY